ncbi:MAG: glycogen debranching enzyme N-terminal domain-containing protein [Cyanobacteria bacterium]|nr:glycogen debranching enzyme N-terminal domain-containing protein [Cyanobacteriota bacterium]MDA0865408.1 glycogen debranching enzyme N-terminal domain-containing protein [Cyanobacteriota bacterium]
MPLQFSRDICGDLAQAEQREWLITNGIGGYGCGTMAGLLTRHYHGLLIAALKPPLGRTLLFAKLDETVHSGDETYQLGCDRWSPNTLTGHGYRHLERFHLEGTTPVWTYALGANLLEKRVWMEPGANTTYGRYTLIRGIAPIQLQIKGFANYRDHHHSTHANDWQMQVETVADGLKITAFEAATPLYWRVDRGALTPEHTWYQGYHLAIEQYRGIDATDDHLHVGTVNATLDPGASLTLVVSTDPTADRDGAQALKRRYDYERSRLPIPLQNTEPEGASPCAPTPFPTGPEGTNLYPLTPLAQLHLAADQFIVDRTVEGTPGKTIIAGYPWFGDWGRDTMIALPGLTLATGRFDVARTILQTFACYLDQGMLPNVFPEAGQTPHYNTVDAILWYFQAVRAYWVTTEDQAFLAELFPVLETVIQWHQTGTRYQIHLDTDGLLYAGEAGVQLTWMDAKVGDWVVTPRIGKPVEVNALWYNALVTMGEFAQVLGKASEPYQYLADQARQGFQRFWQGERGYCYDVLDGPDGDDATLRPNQIFAVSLPASPLTAAQQKAVVDTVARRLLTSHGLRSLDCRHPDYVGHYGGDPLQRDGSYHQGTVWGWLIGPFVQAHWRVYEDATAVGQFLQPLVAHLGSGCVGNLSEIFDGEAPFIPRGTFAQAWTVAAVLQGLQIGPGACPADPSPLLI